jgi:parallel beta-helix repeat protein
MRKQFRLYAILTVLICGMLAATSKTLLPEAKATWIWDDIQQNTVWTLTDSPFILIRNITVESGHRLTIEPGVEVRFGGHFSLVINGTLYAVGTPERTIKFVSNKDQPQPGDWGTIEFANKTSSSTLAYSVIKHAVYGAAIVNGNTTIRNCEISNNYYGIYLTGDNAGFIEDNTIQLNGDGILLSGTTSGITIRENRISANIENGMNLQSPAGTYINNIVIFNNTLSSNSRGINIYGNASTGIQKNSVSFNDIGIYCENLTKPLSPQFNDIYGNMNATQLVQNQPIDPTYGYWVNATYNYWGDQTGAYHESLNPQGKGNPVQSDGYDLLFIPYLSEPNNYVNTRPFARLLSDRVLVQPDQPIDFIATNSSDDRRVDKYFFDFGDGQSASWTTLSIFQHKYTLVGVYQASLRVMDDFGAISNNAATVTINVQALTPLDVSISLSHLQMVSEGTVTVTVRAMLGSTPVSAANIVITPILGGTLTPQSGSTDSEGYFTSSYKAPTVSEQTNIRIIARAYRAGNADGSAHQYLEVVPPLAADIALSSSLIKSEASVDGTVYVTYNSNPVENAMVALTSDNGGTLTPQSASTDEDGWIQFTYQAPQTFTQLSVTLTATITKIGYWSGSDQVQLSVVPKILTVDVVANPTTVDSEDSASITVHVSSEGIAVENATVTVSSDVTGEFSNSTGLTDINGDLQMIFTAPQTPDMIGITISAVASKSGYVNGQNQTSLTVNPAGGQGAGTVFGLSLTTLLLIIVPVIVVVVVVVLIKKRIIVFSRGGEAE